MIKFILFIEDRPAGTFYSYILICTSSGFQHSYEISPSLSSEGFPLALSHIQFHMSHIFPISHIFPWLIPPLYISTPAIAFWERAHGKKFFVNLHTTKFFIASFHLTDSLAEWIILVWNISSEFWICFSVVFNFPKLLPKSHIPFSHLTLLYDVFFFFEVFSIFSLFLVFWNFRMISFHGSLFILHLSEHSDAISHL